MGLAPLSPSQTTVQFLLFLPALPVLPPVEGPVVRSIPGSHRYCVVLRTLSPQDTLCLASHSIWCLLALGPSRFFAPEWILPGDVEADCVMAAGPETPEEKDVVFTF